MRPRCLGASRRVQARALFVRAAPRAAAAAVAAAEAASCSSSTPAAALLGAAGQAQRRARCARRVGVEQLTVAAAAAAAGAFPAPDASGRPQLLRLPGDRALWLALAAAAAVGAGAAALWPHAPAIQACVCRSGFPAAFSLILLSEIGDKTFFLTAILAARLGRLVAFTGSVAALGGMTIISVAAVAAFSRLPGAVQAALPVGQLAGLAPAMLVFFGLRSLNDAYRAPPSGPRGGGGRGKAAPVQAAGAVAGEGALASEGGSEEASGSSEDACDELAEARAAVEQAEAEARARRGGKAGGSGGNGRGSWWANMAEVASLCFAAEFGDRSMFAVMGLAAAFPPAGVAAGATAAHGAASAVAVLGGALAARHVSERALNAASGLLMLAFAAAALLARGG